MKRRSRLIPWAVGLIALLTAVSCGEQPVQPMHELSAKELQPHFTTYNPSTKTLGVSIFGSGKIEHEGADSSYKYKGVFTGGVRPFHMYWFVELCYTDGFCTGRHGAGSGENVDSVNIFIPSDAKWLKVLLYVGDAQSPSFTGNSTKTIIGPASDVTGLFGTCIEDPPTLMGDTYFPFINPVPPDPIHQDSIYYYTSCGLGHQVYREHGDTVGRGPWGTP
jgi:hypothetical protein